MALMFDASMRMHSKTSFHEGQRVELECQNLLGRCGIKTTPSKEWEDLYDHIDFWMRLEGYTFGVDVKGNSAMFALDQNWYHFVELQNVKGLRGSLYGKAHFLAFQIKKSFLFVNRKDLLSFIEHSIDRSKLYFNCLPIEDHYLKQFRSHVYSQHRNDIITVVKRSDLKKCRHFYLTQNGIQYSTSS